jgi:PAS domain S-box-containing protein
MMSSDPETLEKGSIGGAIDHPSHLFHTAIEESAEAVVITDAQGKIEYVNRAFTRITGYSREEALGQNLRILKSGEHDAAFYQQLWKTILNGESWHGELINRRKDGSFYNEEMSIAPVRTQGGEVTHFVASKKDVTSRRQLEQQLRWAESVEAIGRLAGGVVHELNNVLAIISGYGQLLQQRVRPEGLGAVEEILKAGDRAAALTRQLLAFSRYKILATQVLNLNSVVTDMEKMLRLLVGEDIELAIVQQEDLGMVKADQGQMEGVILNLAVNARDAMPQGGKITIATANVCLSDSYSRTHVGATPGPHVLLSVGYTGTGIDDERQEHLFEPLPTTVKIDMEPGLGLATVFGVIKQDGGHLWVHGEPSRGKTFKVYLPRIEDAAPALDPSQGVPQ